MVLSYGITMDFVVQSIFDDNYLLSDNPSCDRMSIACGAMALMDWLLINPWCGHNTCSKITLLCWCLTMMREGLYLCPVSSACVLFVLAWPRFWPFRPFVSCRCLWSFSCSRGGLPKSLSFRWLALVAALVGVCFCLLLVAAGADSGSRVQFSNDPVPPLPPTCAANGELWCRKA